MYRDFRVVALWSWLHLEDLGVEARVGGQEGGLFECHGGAAEPLGDLVGAWPGEELLLDAVGEALALRPEGVRLVLLEALEVGVRGGRGDGGGDHVVVAGAGRSIVYELDLLGLVGVEEGALVLLEPLHDELLCDLAAALLEGALRLGLEADGGAQLVERDDLGVVIVGAWPDDQLALLAHHWSQPGCLGLVPAGPLLLVQREGVLERVLARAHHVAPHPAVHHLRVPVELQVVVFSLLMHNSVLSFSL